MIEAADVIVLGTPSLDKEMILSCLSEHQTVVDLVHLSKAERLASESYHGICW